LFAGMDGYRLMKAAFNISENICSNCKIGGMTFKTLPGFLEQIEAEQIKLHEEIESLKLQNSLLLRRDDPQTSFELLDGKG